jgi:hypothetical protein
VTDVVVFLGPTLAHDEARSVLDAEYLPPAGHGDVLRAALRRPRVIALVDGVFERVPAVWHKEILFALSEGVHVYGAASMGALRAAELDSFGMHGVGEVYRAYAEGVLEDDDEVAVAHADAEHGFRALSDSMVDVRATLDAAVGHGVVTEETAAVILRRVKATFYADRLLVGALDGGDAEHERLRAWLPTGWVRRKRDDALALLRGVASEVEKGLEPPRPRWVLQRTRFWEDARHAVQVANEPRGAPVSAPTADHDLEAVLDEARLDPDGYGRLLERSLLTALARHAAASVGVDVSSWAHETALERERRRRGLLEPEDVDGWLDERGLRRTDLPAVARRLAVLRWAHEAHRDSVAGEVALTLRTDDAYAGLAARAARKREALGALPSAEDPVVDDAEVVDWYFRERLGREVPVALDAWAQAHGWQRVGDLLRALRSEWLFRTAAGGD